MKMKRICRKCGRKFEKIGKYQKVCFDCMSPHTRKQMENRLERLISGEEKRGCPNSKRKALRRYFSKNTPN